MACERRHFLMAAPYCLMFRAIALTLRAGLRGLRPPSAPLRRLRDISLVAQPPLLREEGSIPPEELLSFCTASIYYPPSEVPHEKVRFMHRDRFLLNRGCYRGRRGSSSDRSRQEIGCENGARPDRPAYRCERSRSGR